MAVFCSEAISAVDENDWIETVRTAIYVIIAILIVTVAGGAFLALEGTSPDSVNRDLCFAEKKVDENAQVQACTSLINSPRFMPDEITRAYRSRAVANESLRRYTNASMDADEAVSRVPDAASLAVRCAVNIAERNYSKAVEDCTASLYSRHGKEDSNVAILYVWKSMAYEGERQYTVAINNANQALALDPHSALAFAMRCDIRDILGDTVNAASDCDKAISLDGTEEIGFAARGFLNLKQGLYAEAERDFATTLTLDPSFPAALYGRGLIERHQGKVADAQVDIETAKRLDKGVVSDIAEYGLKS